MFYNIERPFEEELRRMEIANRLELQGRVCCDRKSLGSMEFRRDIQLLLVSLESGR